jgi:hypothetical protein
MVRVCGENGKQGFESRVGYDRRLPDLTLYPTHYCRIHIYNISQFLLSSYMVWQHGKRVRHTAHHCERSVPMELVARLGESGIKHRGPQLINQCNVTKQ